MVEREDSMSPKDEGEDDSSYVPYYVPLPSSFALQSHSKLSADQVSPEISPVLPGQRHTGDSITNTFTECSDIESKRAFETTKRDDIQRCIDETPSSPSSTDDVRDYILSSGNSFDCSSSTPMKPKWVALIISSSFFFISGLDGMLYCMSATNQRELETVAPECTALFLTKIVPSALVTACCSILALCELSMSSKVSVHLVGIPAVLSFAVCAYSLLEVMLVSHKDASDPIQEWADRNFDEDEPESLFFFQSPSLQSSLYAINDLGEIGDNANLYHATWLTLFVTMSLSYQYMYPIFLYSCCKSYLFWKKHKIQKKFYFRHRERIKSWLAILISCITVLASSTLIWDAVLEDECSYAITQSREENEGTYQRDDDGNVVDDDGSNDKISILKIHPRICASTELAMFMGSAGAVLALVTVVVHSSSHRLTNGIPLEQTNTSLKLETFFSGVLALAFGYGSMFLTGSYQGGLAQNVGNLYYATWVAFIFSVRVFIGCTEELYAGDDDDDGIITTSSEKQQQTTINSEETVPQYQHDKKISAMKRWCTISLFSAINHGAAFDAAQQYFYTNYGKFDENTSPIIEVFDGISPSQRWTLLCPFIVMLFTVNVSLLHFSSRAYNLFYDTKMGFVFSLGTFLLCISQIVIAQHSENSLALNHIGEVINANLYYFTWASVVTAGLNFSTYLHTTFGLKPKSFTFALWFGMVKVGLIIMGSSSEVWVAIVDSCQNYGDVDNDEIENVEAMLRSLCWRTKFSVISGILGTCLACVICACLLLHWKHTFIFQWCISTFLVIMFVVGAGTTTGMGGPAQKVGDLYYSTWLALLVSLMLLADCLGKLDVIYNKAHDTSKPSEEKRTTTSASTLFVAVKE